jgi:hypothetical protein
MHLLLYSHVFGESLRKFHFWRERERERKREKEKREEIDKLVLVVSSVLVFSLQNVKETSASRLVT